MFFLRIVPLVLLISSVSWGEAETCGSVTNYQQILSCAEKRSPEVQRAEAAVQQKKASTEAAGQLLNPDLSIETVTGTVDSERKTDTDVSLSFPIELGGKRAARKGIAGGELNRAELELFQARSNARKEVLIKLIRVRQFFDEQALVEESFDTFSKLVKQYESRPSRSPEQEVTLTVFKIAKGDYGFKKIEYEEETARLEAFFKINLGLSLQEVKNALPEKSEKWKTFEIAKADVANSPLLALYQADIEVARGQLAQAQGDAWPTLRVGPSVKFSKDKDQNLEQWGANLSMPLPLLSLNKGAKAAAHASVQSAELRKNLAFQELQQERETLVTLYKRSIAALNETPSSQFLEKNHKRIEGLFVKGVVPSALVIEAHRSLVDFEKTRNEREIKALAAYFNIQIIDGQNVGLQP